MYRVISGDKLWVLFRTDRNESVTSSHTCENFPQFYDFVPKAILFHRDSNQVIKRAITNDGSVLQTEVADSEDNAIEIKSMIPTWNKYLKQFTCREILILLAMNVRDLGLL